MADVRSRDAISVGQGSNRRKEPGSVRPDVKVVAAGNALQVVEQVLVDNVANRSTDLAADSTAQQYAKGGTGNGAQQAASRAGKGTHRCTRLGTAKSACCTTGCTRHGANDTAGTAGDVSADDAGGRTMGTKDHGKSPERMGTKTRGERRTGAKKPRAPTSCYSRPRSAKLTSVERVTTK
ncbi:hypothetical protein [Acidovorax soli]|uniref:hypothetical protein n=1 Tax=Acidovorax soli TaxID=592050 RepID=UPI001C87AEFB|nr:hypothetical protein [Acidovorax soli]